MCFNDQCKEIEGNNRVGQTRDLFKKIRDSKGIFHAKLCRSGTDLAEAEILATGGKHIQKNYTKKILMPPYNCDSVISHLEPGIREYEINWALGSIMINKASGGNEILAELFQTLKDDTVKVLHSICQQVWKTQQWPQD